MIEFKISKRTLEAGWAEINIVTRRALNDTPDFELEGEPARLKIAKTVVSMAAGIALVLGDERFEQLCVKFARKHKLLLP